MRLTEYIHQSGGTGALSCPVVAQIATDARCSHRTLYMIAKGHKQAGPILARRIECATEGNVTARELRPDYFGDIAGSDTPQNDS